MVAFAAGCAVFLVGYVAGYILHSVDRRLDEGR